MSFEKAFAHAIKAEGGYSNHPNDKGGPTNLGITQATLSDYLGRPATADDVKSLTVDAVRPIYKRRYWDPMKLDLLTNEEDQLVLYVQGLNRGTRTIVMSAQEVLRQSFGKKLTVDGDNGSVTSGFINQLPQDAFVREFLQAETLAYDDICIRNNSQLVFLKGWHNRIANLQDIVWSNGSAGLILPVEQPKEQPVVIIDPKGWDGAKVLALARAELGTKEIAGSKHNPRIVLYHSYTTLHASTDEVPWCASFVCYILAMAGYKSTRSAAAASYVNYGVAGDGSPGDIATWTRNGGSGYHVNIVAKKYKKGDQYVVCVGGNQGNNVTEVAYPVSRLRHFRRAA